MAHYLGQHPALGMCARKGTHHLATDLRPGLEDFRLEPTARARICSNELRWGGVGRAILITLTSDHEIGPPTGMAPRSVVG